MEISSINFVSKSLVFPERRGRSLPLSSTILVPSGIQNRQCTKQNESSFFFEDVGDHANYGRQNISSDISKYFVR